MAVAKAIELLGIDRVDDDASLDERLDDRSARSLDGDRHTRGLGALEQCVSELVESLPRVRHRALEEHGSVGPHHAYLMRLRPPVDPYVTFDVVHIVGPFCPTATTDRDAASPLYWRSRRDFPRDVHRGPPRRGAVPNPVEPRPTGGDMALTDEAAETVARCNHPDEALSK
jgi:hypothetical protein